MKNAMNVVVSGFNKNCIFLFTFSVLQQNFPQNLNKTVQNQTKN